MALSFLSAGSDTLDDGDDVSDVETVTTSDPDRWRRLGRYAIYGGLIPATVIVLLGAGWYIGTGETPFALVRRLTMTPSITMAMPANPNAKPPAAAPEKPKAAEKTAAEAKPADQNSTAMLKPPEPAKGVMPLAPAPEPAQPATGAVPAPAPEAAKPAEPAKKEADAKPADAAAPKEDAAPPPAEPEAATPSLSANKSLTPVKPIPLSKAGEAPPPAPEPAKTAEAPKGEAPAAEAKSADQQAMAAPAPPPPPMNEPQAPSAGEPLAPPSFAQLPARTDLKPLGPAPVGDLLKDSPDGPLPVADGTKEARTVYARPFVEPKETTAGKVVAKVAVVVVGLGVSREAAEAAIAKLPPEVGLSFSPYAGNLDTWVKKARAAGHEVLLDLPLEPANFPLHDAGPMAIMTKDSPSAAGDRLRAILGRATSYVGVSAALHSPVTSAEDWAPLLRDIKARGLLFLGDGLAGMKTDDVPASATVALVPDETPFRAAIDAGFARVLATAQRDGSAIAYVSPRPVTFERLLAWAATLPQKGAVLAPASALVKAP